MTAGMRSFFIEVYMARIKDLEVYKCSYQFNKMIMDTKINMPVKLKNDLGQMTMEACLRITRGIVIANESRDKTRILQRVLIEIDVIWQFLRMMYDFKTISRGQYEVLSEKLTDLSMQLQKWLNWSKEENRKQAQKQLFKDPKNQQVQKS